jgi:hypothetical protein
VVGRRILALTAKRLLLFRAVERSDADEEEERMLFSDEDTYKYSYLYTYSYTYLFYFSKEFLTEGTECPTAWAILNILVLARVLVCSTAFSEFLSEGLG